VNHDGEACPSPEREMAIVGALKIVGNNPNRKKLRLRIAVPTAERTGEEKHSHHFDEKDGTQAEACAPQGVHTPQRDSTQQLLS